MKDMQQLRHQALEFLRTLRYIQNTQGVMSVVDSNPGTSLVDVLHLGLGRQEMEELCERLAVCMPEEYRGAGRRMIGLKD
ncbi:hypothetical protein HNR42_000350 [Deinobacterium chartae]|uniref:Uncharacterized protein n=1 Tax=Deinobacterium chartae TaxID=521158 RepID=A0A841HYC4_9DEIO|nr:hypothetical protein [Deinobacterium chartae]MBB6096938.1 hypothetical protein [Deinobacterium chartae]